MIGASGPSWDRFAHWRPGPARLLLAALLALLVAAALTPLQERKSSIPRAGFAENIAAGGKSLRERDGDLALYDTAIERIRKGEHYYDFIMEEQRRARYPVTPGFAVRLPTLAYIDAWLGSTGQALAAILLMFAVLIVWRRRLGEEPGGPDRRVMAMTLLFLGVSLGLNRYFFVLHELWAGMLLALAFGLHRPGRWKAALACAALALAIREIALPFVLLMTAMALWRRDWKEAAAWSLLAVLFTIAMATHLSIIAAQVLPSDPPSRSWLAMRGIAGWLSNVALSSNLRYLPYWLAGPAVILMTFGWAGWRSSAGAFGTLLFLGYGLFFMLASRVDNYYWGAMVAPTMFIGLAFAPRALRSLLKAARAEAIAYPAGAGHKTRP